MRFLQCLLILTFYPSFIPLYKYCLLEIFSLQSTIHPRYEFSISLLSVISTIVCEKCLQLPFFLLFFIPFVRQPCLTGEGFLKNLWTFTNIRLPWYISLSLLLGSIDLYQYHLTPSFLSITPSLCTI